MNARPDDDEGGETYDLNPFGGGPAPTWPMAPVPGHNDPMAWPFNPLTNDSEP